MAAPFKYTAEQLQQKYIEYIEFMKDKFDIKVDYIKSGERAGELIEIKLPKIKSIEGFCLFAKIDVQTFYNYCNKESINIDEQLFESVTYIRRELLEYRKSLGLNNIINPNLLMAIDGIKQTIDINHNEAPNSLPLHINNNVIDLTESDYTILNTNVNKSELKLSE